MVEAHFYVWFLKGALSLPNPSDETGVMLLGRWNQKKAESGKKTAPRFARRLETGWPSATLPTTGKGTRQPGTNFKSRQANRDPEAALALHSDCSLARPRNPANRHELRH
jgi:hypothetical protein